MSASDSLHPVQFHRERLDADIDRHLAEGESAGRDVGDEFGYDRYDMSDAQWNRKRHDDRKEVF